MRKTVRPAQRLIWTAANLRVRRKWFESWRAGEGYALARRSNRGADGPFRAWRARRSRFRRRTASYAAVDVDLIAKRSKNRECVRKTGFQIHRRAGRVEHQSRPLPDFLVGVPSGIGYGERSVR